MKCGHNFPSPAVSPRAPIPLTPSPSVVISADAKDATDVALLDRFGSDMAMPDILNAITQDCGKNAPLSTDRCKAVYRELAGGR